MEENLLWLSQPLHPRMNLQPLQQALTQRRPLLHCLTPLSLTPMVESLKPLILLPQLQRETNFLTSSAPTWTRLKTSQANPTQNPLNPAATGAGVKPSTPPLALVTLQTSQQEVLKLQPHPQHQDLLVAPTTAWFLPRNPCRGLHPHSTGGNLPPCSLLRASRCSFLAVGQQENPARMHYVNWGS